MLKLIDHTLSVNDEKISSILHETIEYKSIELIGHIYYDNTWNDDVDKQFWENLNKSVTKLVFYTNEELVIKLNHMYDDLFNNLPCLTNLKELHVSIQYIKWFSDPKYMERSCLEKIYVHDFQLPYHTSHKPVYLITDFYDDTENYTDDGLLKESENIITNILMHCVRLKSFKIPTKIKSSIMSLNNIAATLNFHCLQMNDVFTNCENLPETEFCTVIEIQIEIFRDDSKVVFDVTSLDIFVSKERPCFFSHQICMNESLSSIRIVDAANSCMKCWEVLLDSSPNIKRFEHLNQMQPIVAQSLIPSKLIKLECLEMNYTLCMSNWPQFFFLKKLIINLSSDCTSKDFKTIIQKFPNLKKLHVKGLAVSFTAQTLLEIINQSKLPLNELKLGECLTISEDVLNLFVKYIPKIQTLKFYSSASYKKGCDLFDNLKELESVVHCTMNHRTTHFTKDDFLMKVLPHNMNDSEDENHEILDSDNEEDQYFLGLPEEMWVMIFSYLPSIYQITCRQVCRDWYRILETHPYFKEERRFELKNCILSPSSDPVRTILNGNFNYEIIDVLTNFMVAEFENLTEFWIKLGKTVKTICLNEYLEIESLIAIIKSGMNCQNFPNLESVEVMEHANVFPKIFKENECIPMFEAIKELKIMEIASIDACPVFNNLEKMLILHVRQQDILPKLLNNNCPKLKELTILNCLESKILSQIIFTIEIIHILKLGIQFLSDEDIKIIAQHGKNLKKITLSSTNMSQFTLRSIAEQFFEKLFSLHEVTFGLMSINIEDTDTLHDLQYTFFREGHDIVEYDHYYDD